MVARRYEFCSTGVEKYSTNERSKPVNSSPIPVSVCASSSVSLNVGYNTAVINQNVIYLFRTEQVLGMPFYSGLAVHIAQGYQSTSMLSLMPTATRGGTWGII